MSKKNSKKTVAPELTTEQILASWRKLGIKPVKKSVKKEKAAKVARLAPKATASSFEAPVAQVIRDLIVGGWSNAEILEQMGEILGDERKHYPAWYRGQLNRAGAL